MAITIEFRVGSIVVCDFHGILIDFFDARQGINEKFYFLAGHYRKLIMPVYMLEFTLVIRSRFEIGQMIIDALMDVVIG